MHKPITLLQRLAARAEASDCDCQTDDADLINEAISEIEKLKAVEIAAAQYISSVNGEPEKDCWDTEDGKEAPGAERFASDWAWKAYDDKKQKAFDALADALKGDAA